MANIDDVVKQAKKAKRNSVKRNGSIKKDQQQSKTDNIEDISYSNTKVITVDNEALTRNRVIAQNKEDPRSTPFHMLRTKVLRELRDNNWNSIAISAPTPGAGKSLVTVNLAVSIAMETNQTVLIVDMDLRKPSIHKYFSFEPEYGLQDFIDGNASVEDIMINPGIDRLVIMPGRKRVLNSSEQLSSPMLRTLTEELKNKYESRVILYDLPPLLVSDDVLAFLPNVDSSLLVIESGQNTKEEIEASMAMLEQKPLLGTVLNKELKAPKLYIY